MKVRILDTIFKFHCDSINMRNKFEYEAWLTTLNSTVILLIYFQAMKKDEARANFKFHCDSINIEK